MQAEDEPPRRFTPRAVEIELEPADVLAPVRKLREEEQTEDEFVMPADVDELEDADAMEDAEDEEGLTIDPVEIENGILGKEGDPNAFRKTSSEKLKGKIERIEAVYPLTETQRRKLDVAGRGDVARFQEDVRQMRIDFTVPKVPADRINELQQRYMELVTRRDAGLHGEDSLFQKTLRSALDSEELSKLGTAVRKAARKRHKAKVDAVFATIDNALALTAEQREKLHTLISSRTPAPKFDPFEFLTSATDSEEWDEGYDARFLKALADIADEDFQKIVTERQWPKFSLKIGEFRRRADRLREP